MESILRHCGTYSSTLFGRASFSRQLPNFLARSKMPTLLGSNLKPLTRGSACFRKYRGSTTPTLAGPVTHPSLTPSPNTPDVLREQPDGSKAVQNPNCNGQENGSLTPTCSLTEPGKSNNCSPAARRRKFSVASHRKRQNSYRNQQVPASQIQNHRSLIVRGNEPMKCVDCKTKCFEMLERIERNELWQSRTPDPQGDER